VHKVHKELLVLKALKVDKDSKVRREHKEH
jgi:hypothetical protein